MLNPAGCIQQAWRDGDDGSVGERLQQRIEGSAPTGHVGIQKQDDLRGDGRDALIDCRRIADVAVISDQMDGIAELRQPLAATVVGRDPATDLALILSCFPGPSNAGALDINALKLYNENSINSSPAAAPAAG